MFEKAVRVAAVAATALGFSQVGLRGERNRRSVGPGLANSFWQRYVSFVKQVGQQLDIKVNIVDCQNQEAKQLQDIENLIAPGVTELIVTPQTAQVGPAILNGRSRRTFR